ncbi:hypothetical protein FACS1894178_3370 [Bacteroidia bacterium]|nr:hypothetical protein FACS1894178_3370 [Bacteroidia bacterium]
MTQKTKIITIILISVSALIFLILFLSSFYTIKTGEQGVVLRFGKLTTIADEGLNWKIPFVDNVYRMSVRDMRLQREIEVSSSDIQTIKVEVSLVYSLNAAEIEHIFRTYRTNIEDILIMPTIDEKIQAVIAEYPIEEFVEKRQEISTKISSAFVKQMQGNGVLVKSCLIVNHDFNDDFDKAIENKKIAEQKALEAKYTLEQKKLEAEAQKIKQASLSPMVLQEMAINKWDGHLPQYMGANAPLPFIGVK